MSDALPVLRTGHLFHGLARRLVSLLDGLPDEAWNLPTCYPTWKVRNISAHLLQTAIGRLSSQRDGFHQPTSDETRMDFQTLSSRIDELNTSWGEALSSVSPRILVDLSRRYERRLADHLRRLASSSIASIGVGWAGEDVSPGWFDAAREFTERWHHQQQIRDAVGATSISFPKYLKPVLSTLIRGVPFWYQTVAGNEGDCLEIRISGPAGGTWLMERRGGRWLFVQPRATNPPDARVEMTEETAWRFLTRTIPAGLAEPRIEFSGKRVLSRHFLNVISVMIPEYLR